VWGHNSRLLTVTFFVVGVLVCVAAAFILLQDNGNRIALEQPTSCTPLGAEQTCIQLEVVRNRDDHRRGLSGRQSLAEDAGMLFDFTEEGTRCMYMPNMNFAIDIIWLSDEHEVVDVMSDIIPETYPERFCGAEPARYVIEVNSGVVDESDVEVGQVIEL